MSTKQKTKQSVPKWFNGMIYNEGATKVKQLQIPSAAKHTI
jgi:hypothetical protein